MTLLDYLKDRILVILLNGLTAFFLALYLLSVGNSWVTINLITIFWLGTVIVWFSSDYIRRKKYFSEIMNTLADLENPYLIQEFMGQTWRLEDKLYQQILRSSNKSVIEKIRALEEEQKEYREFIEGWIHEAKLPITGMRLTAHNQKGELQRKLEIYLTELDNIVEQALFYARSEEVYKDYTIKETDLKQVINRVISRNKYLLIQQQINVKSLTESTYVQTDGKWLDFILGQIMINAVKYKKDSLSEISFSLEETEYKTKLSIKDNGIGIADNELGRIFEKGFTGTNGRIREKTTGIGLYLCKKLCKKLELVIEADSVQNEFTEITLVFPKNSYLAKLTS